VLKLVFRSVQFESMKTLLVFLLLFAVSVLPVVFAQPSPNGIPAGINFKYLKDNTVNTQAWSSAFHNEVHRRFYIEEYQKGLKELKNNEHGGLRLVFDSADHGYAEAQCFMGLFFVSMYNEHHNKLNASSAYLYLSEALNGYLKSGFDVSNSRKERQKYLLCRSYRGSITIELSTSEKKAMQLAALEASLYKVGSYAD